jgi:hypothetical protein
MSHPRDYGVNEQSFYIGRAATLEREKLRNDEEMNAGNERV